MTPDRQLERPITQHAGRCTHRVAAAALALLCALQVGAVAAQNVRRGEMLYENQCSDCHDRNVHQRDTYRIDTVSDVRAWVASWAAHQELGWSAEEIDDVTLYLARQIYRFDR